MRTIRGNGIPVEVAEGASGLSIRLRQHDEDGDVNKVWLTKEQSIHLASELLKTALDEEV